MSKLELQEGENLVREEGAMYLKSKLNAKGGWLVLTDRRLAFLARKYTQFGLLGVLFGSKARGTLLFDIPLAEIEGWAQSKHGVNDKVIAVKRGGEELRFVTDSPYPEWDVALNLAGA